MCMAGNALIFQDQGSTTVLVPEITALLHAVCDPGSGCLLPRQVLLRFLVFHGNLRGCC